MVEIIHKSSIKRPPLVIGRIEISYKNNNWTSQRFGVRWGIYGTYTETNFKKNESITVYTFSYTHISNGHFYLSVKLFPHAWKMFNYFCVSYREMLASTSISPIFHLKNVSERGTAIIYLYSRRTACHCFSCRQKFDF